MTVTSAAEHAKEPGVSANPRPPAAHYKAVPESRELRERLRHAAAEIVRPLDRSRPPTKALLRELGEKLLGDLGLSTDYLGFAMVCVNNEFWREQLMAVDFRRRLLLLPHCLKHAEGCPADYDELGLNCRQCGACVIADFKVQAEQLGYKVLVAEGTPIVLKIIISGYVDGVVGVACLNVLEKAIDKVLQVGVPALAVPLLSSNCKNTSVDEDWVREVIGLQMPAPAYRTRTYLPLLRSAEHLFNGELERLAPPSRQQNPKDPLAQTEAVAYEWLRIGGKRFRPFITLAAYDACTGGHGTVSDQVALPDPVRRVALAIEAFHKASLVHDDIEDDDPFRYGRETLHRRFGVPSAINIGDYLIGLGYRLVSCNRKELGGECAADILHKLAEAHLKLSEGQGAELAWRTAAERQLTPLDALKIYALKTAPAFEAALYAGMRLADGTLGREKAIAEFCRHVGVAFQILNDLKDWDEDDANKRIVGADALSARPTVLYALALEGSSGPQRQILQRLASSPVSLGAATDDREAALALIYSLYERSAAFARARELVARYRERALDLADRMQPEPLQDLLYFLVETVLEERPAEKEKQPSLSPA